ncbi:MAG: SIR2 family NAD-dependent protein deacylase [Christensenellaceae bacterium]|jgi:SIR2 family protein
MKESLQNRIDKLHSLIQAAECVIVGGGSGLSSAAGLTYSGERFTANFGDFIKRYDLTDMYSAAFYPFKTQEEKWAYWSRHILLNRWQPPALPLYQTLFELVGDKDYFVITTNVDAQFYKAGFAQDRVFAVQGDYGKLQCAKGCQDTLYDSQNLVRRMVSEQKDCRVPSALVPKCPVCGGEMEVNIRKDLYFVQDKTWYAAKKRYEDFYDRACGKNTVLLELGVGYNTPTIIRFPFERMVYENKGVFLVRMNTQYPEAIPENAAKTLSFGEDISAVFDRIK